MASNICPCLLNEVWRSYANDLDNVPETEGIYAIGDASGNVVYVGHSHNMRMRLGEHKSGPQAIDQFVKEFERNGGINLRIKWVEEAHQQCVEGEYLECIAKKVGYWPQYNIQRGNR